MSMSLESSRGFQAMRTSVLASVVSLLYCKLQRRIEHKRQRVLTVGERYEAAYLRLRKEVFVLRASAMCFAPSTPILLLRLFQGSPAKLQT